MLRCLPILCLISFSVSSSWANTAHLYAVAGDANGAVVAGSAGTVRFASGGHTTFNEPVMGDVTTLLRGAIHNGYANYFVVGDSGTVLLSSGANGSAFLIQTSGVTEDLHAVAPFLGCMIAVGESGRILRSAALTGGGWTTIDSPTSVTLRGVAKGTTAGVAVGDGGVILKGNTSGTSWELVSLHPAEGSELRAVDLLADGRFLAVGAAGTVVRGAASGLEWTLLDPPAQVDFNGVAARTTNPARVVAVGTGGSIYTSTNAGDTWSDVSPGMAVTLRAVVYTGTDFLVVGDRGTILRSVEGLVWDDQTPTRRESWGGMKRLFR